MYVITENVRSDENDARTPPGPALGNDRPGLVATTCDAGPMIGSLHHIELWVPDVAAATKSFGWLLLELGWSTGESWPGGASWRLGDTYLVATTPPTITAAEHDRRAPGLNHLAFHSGTCAHTDRVMRTAGAHGWSPLYSDRYPHAGGPDHYAGYLENSAGFKVELVASDQR
jgi:hypothetical protein